VIFQVHPSQGKWPIDAVEVSINITFGHEIALVKVLEPSGFFRFLNFADIERRQIHLLALLAKIKEENAIFSVIKIVGHPKMLIKEDAFINEGFAV
jgi:hypothetical protein